MENNNPTGAGSMILVHSNFGQAASFRLIPASKDCPYVEVLFDPERNILVPVLNVIKDSYHMLPKLDDNGDVQELKLTKRSNGKNYKEERRLVQTFSEFYIYEKDSIEYFINLFAVNANQFDYKSFFTSEDSKAPAPIIQM